MLDKIISIAMCVSTLISVCISAYAVSQSKREKLTGTYFENMASAYGDYLSNIAKFVYHPSDETRDALSCSLYTVILYASSDVLDKAQYAYNAAIDFSRFQQDNPLSVDVVVNSLGTAMRRDLNEFRRTGER